MTKRRRRNNLILVIGSVVVIAVIVVAALVYSNANNSSAKGLTDPNKLNPASAMLANGTTAPDFTLSTVDGKKYTLSSFRGHPVLLEFFAVWCPHCQHEAPIIESLTKEYASEGLQTLAVLANPYGRNYDTSGGSDLRLANAGDINWYKQQFGATYPMLIDPNFTVVNEYGAGSYPTIYVIDRKGIVRSSSQGEVPQNTMVSRIQAALK